MHGKAGEVVGVGEGTQAALEVVADRRGTEISNECLCLGMRGDYQGGRRVGPAQAGLMGQEAARSRVWENTLTGRVTFLGTQGREFQPKLTLQQGSEETWRSFKGGGI